MILPIVFLTARDAVEDRLGGFELGADDYLVKPFALEVLLARVRAVLRRTGRLGAAIEAADVVRTNRLAWPRGRFATRADPDRASTTRHTSSASAAWSSPSTS